MVVLKDFFFFLDPFLVFYLKVLVKRVKRTGSQLSLIMAVLLVLFAWYFNPIVCWYSLPQIYFKGKLGLSTGKSVYPSGQTCKICHTGCVSVLLLLKIYLYSYINFTRTNSLLKKKMYHIIFKLCVKFLYCSSIRCMCSVNFEGKKELILFNFNVLFL